MICNYGRVIAAIREHNGMTDNTPGGDARLAAFVRHMMHPATPDVPQQPCSLSETIAGFIEPTDPPA